MTTQRFLNWALAFAVVISVGAIAAMEADDIELEREMSQERHEWNVAVQHCKKLYRVEISVELDESGNKVCVTRRGEVLPWI